MQGIRGSFSLLFFCTNLHTHLASLLLHIELYKMTMVVWRQHLQQQLQDYIGDEDAKEFFHNATTCK